MNIDHININAPAALLEKVKDFYCDVLGFREGRRPAFSKPGYWLCVNNKALIHLMESDSHYENEKQGFFDHFALRTRGLEEVLSSLKLHNIEYKTSYIPEISLTQVFCKDPSGTGVEISFIDEPL